MPSATAPAVFELTDVSDLHTHPTVHEMARDLFPAPPHMLAKLFGPDGSPTPRFMHLANDRFREINGESGPLLGSVARAVTARLNEMRATFAQTEVTEAEAAELEAGQALRDMFRHGFPRCPLTRYAETAGDHADRLAAGATE
ncbi:hypothetical protein ACFUC2_04985 [[Kitasatospora] papulosa]|uniref:hypothetical protein n=1 Tax=[Kitasatospora] papulosa TaxID=1464011 RepID=UPI003639549E